MLEVDALKRAKNSIPWRLLLPILAGVLILGVVVAILLWPAAPPDTGPTDDASANAVTDSSGQSSEPPEWSSGASSAQTPTAPGGSDGTDSTESTDSTDSSGGVASDSTSGLSAEPTEPTEPTTTTPPVTPTEQPDGLRCAQYARFSGQYVEDGRDELVENVAAILVTNTTDRFLDLATLTYDIDGKTATFVVTGLPAGASAWVMEAARLTITDDASFTYLDCVTSYRDGVIASAAEVSITADANSLTAKNNTNRTLENVFVYYKRVHTDGNFFGGITYLVDFGTLAPGASAETLAGHYIDGETEIVRIGWQDG